MASIIKTLAAQTGLSTFTISRYLNGYGVKSVNKAIIDRAIADCKLQLNGVARGLKTGKTNLVGVVIPRIDDIFATTILATLSNLLLARNMVMLILESKFDTKQELAAVKILLQKKVEFLVAIPISDGTNYRCAIESGVRVIFVDQFVQDIAAASVLVNSRNAVRLVTDQMLSIGHREVVFLGGDPAWFTTTQRRKGFEEAFAAHGLPIPKENIIYNPDPTSDGYNNTLSLFKRDRPPTGIVTASYHTTLGAVMALNTLSLDIGKDISLSGFDNIELARIVKPELTTIEQPMDEIARTVNELLDKNSDECVVLEPTIHRGRSVVPVCVPPRSKKQADPIK
ncbi:MAG: LacI family DNA-binding transcriptional regulator [Clostridiales bacterium]|jgi:LacI family transcriptional regulator|nr:LacI family DNA-binding transcriptional regulator [Clostridiales bacterium]